MRYKTFFSKNKHFFAHLNAFMYTIEYWAFLRQKKILYYKFHILGCRIWVQNWMHRVFAPKNEVLIFGEEKTGKMLNCGIELKNFLKMLSEKNEKNNAAFKKFSPAARHCVETSENFLSDAFRFFECCTRHWAKSTTSPLLMFFFPNSSVDN